MYSVTVRLPHRKTTVIESGIESLKLAHFVAREWYRLGKYKVKILWCDMPYCVYK